MNSLAANAVLAAHRATLAVAGVAVQYRRGNDVIDLTLLPARAQVVDDNGDEFSQTSREKDWIVALEDLTVLSAPFLPARGDRILETAIDGAPRHYEVLPRDGERPFRHCDVDGVKIRIFTVETITTADP